MGLFLYNHTSLPEAAAVKTEVAHAAIEPDSSDSDYEEYIEELGEEMEPLELETETEIETEAKPEVETETETEPRRFGPPA